MTCLNVCYVWPKRNPRHSMQQYTLCKGRAPASAALLAARPARSANKKTPVLKLEADRYKMDGGLANTAKCLAKQQCTSMHALLYAHWMLL
jgi:hypothetical protein